MFIVENRDKFLLIIFALLLAVTGIDLYADLSDGTSYEHVLTEAVVLLLSLLGVLWLLWGIRKQHREILALREALADIKQAGSAASGADKKLVSQAEPYVIEARKKLSDVVHQQFTDWGLSKSEQDVGWLLLKGLSLKEIALLRNTLEKTVRQQASAIYKKAGISGRHVFSAWFIEDIL